MPPPDAAELQSLPPEQMAAVLHALETWPPGYHEGQYAGRRWGATLNASPDRRRLNLFARELGGADVVSFNLYRLADGAAKLKPCEMPAEKVAAFVLGWARDATDE
jgi:hypothetical protein